MSLPEVRGGGTWPGIMVLKSCCGKGPVECGDSTENVVSGGVGSEGRGSGGGVSGVVANKAESEVNCSDGLYCCGIDSDKLG